VRVRWWLLEMMVRCQPKPHPQPHKIQSGEVHPTCEGGPGVYEGPIYRPHTGYIQSTHCHARYHCLLPTWRQPKMPPSSARVTNNYGPNKTPSPLLLAASTACDMRLGCIRLQPSIPTYDPAGQYPACDLITPGTSTSVMAQSYQTLGWVQCHRPIAA